MPRSYRCILVAFVGWVALGASSPQNAGEKQPEHSASGGAQAASGLLVQSSAQTAEYEKPCQRGTDNRASDLCAQWKAADAARDAANWAWWQLGVSLFGIVGLGMTLWLTSRSTKAAIEALETQIAHERPLVHIEALALERLKPTKTEPLRYRIRWAAINHGRTGCWLQQVNVTLRPGSTTGRAHLNGVYLMSSFLPVGMTAANPKQNKIYSFTPGQAAVVEDTKSISAIGYALYRDTSHREWMSGFAFLIELDERLDSVGYSPIAKPELWFDSRQ